MPTSTEDHLVTSAEQLASLFDTPSAGALKKEADYLHPHYRAMIEASPFVVLATTGPHGLDASPRGDPPGFVAVQDEHTLLIPERRGNNRVDSLRNILADPRVGLLFLIPGVGETLRIRGRAAISIDPALLARFEVGGRPPKCVLVVSIERVFFQCARAIQRSRLWEASLRSEARPVPTAGAILAALSEGAIDGERYDRELPERQLKTLY